MVRVELILLTQSAKRRNNPVDGYGRCVSGIITRFVEGAPSGGRFQVGSFIRLVNDVYGDSLNRDQMILTNGSLADVLDKVIVPLQDHCSRDVAFWENINHCEDWPIVQGVPWEKVGVANIYDVLQLHPSSGYKYIFGTDNAAVDFNHVKQLKGKSLDVFKVDNLVIDSIYDEVNAKTKVLASFDYFSQFGSNTYCVHYENINVTIRNYYMNCGQHNIGEAYIVVSIPKTGPFTKFIARVFPV